MMASGSTESPRREWSFSSLRVVVPAVLLAFSMVLAFSVWGDMRSRHVRAVAAQNEAEMRVILLQLQNSLSFAASVGDDRQYGLQRLVAATASDPKLVSAYLLSPDGRVLAATRVADIGTTRASLEQGISDQEWESAERRILIRPISVEGSENMLFGAVAIHLQPKISPERDGRSARLLVIRDHSAESAVGLVAANESFKGYVFRILLLLAAIVLFLHWRVTTRLRRLIKAARAFGHGQEVAKISVSGSDELGILAREIEEMVAARGKLEGQLRQSQKMESIGLLAGGIAHDFNNLLTVIMAGGELARRATTNSMVVGNLDDIAHAADRAAALTGQLLAFSRKQPLELSQVNVAQLCETTCDMLERLVGEDVQIIRELDPDVEFVQADKEQLTQVLVNLVVNGRDAMPKGGKLTISVRSMQVDTEQAAALSIDAGSFVCLAVSDVGSGMSKETVARIFDPFFTTKENGKGTGLGLSTVYGIIRQLGGAVDVESAIGVGSTFRVYIPASGDLEKAHAPVPSGAVLPTGTQEAILLIEDEDDVRKMCVKILDGGGYRVLAAKNHQEAMQLFQDNLEDIELLLTDVVLVGPGGPEIAREMRAKKPALRVLYMSGYTDGALDVSGKIPDDVAFIRKPFRPEALIQQVAARLAEAVEEDE